MPPLTTFQSIVGDVHAHALSVDSILVEGWVRDVWNEIERARTWSHLRRQYQIVIPAPYTTGTVTLTPGSQTVTLATGVVSGGWIGRQFQRAAGEPIHEITAIDAGANTFTIFPEWSLTNSIVAAQSYKVFTAYIAVPQDFFAWLSVRDTQRRQRLNVYLTLDALDRFDPQRASSGRPLALVGLDWTRTYAGRVYSTLLVTQSAASPTPTASGSYNGQYDSLLVVRITGTGAVDTATFTYAQDSATPTALTTGSSGNELPMGVTLTWPAGTYTTGTVYVIRLSSNPVLGVVRYEIYPHPTEAMVLSSTYSTRPLECEAADWTVPAPLTGDIISLGAKDLMARTYPGTRDKPNPYAQIGRSTELRDRFEEAVGQCMTLDEYIITQNVFQAEEMWPVATLPWFGATRTYDAIYPI